MPLYLSYLPISPYCRAVLITARAVGVNLILSLKEVDPEEEIKPDFLVNHPQHTVPRLLDGELVLWESGVICTYLAARYGKDDHLYPRDPNGRAKVDSMLDFTLGILASRWCQVIHPVKLGERKKPTAKSVTKFHEALGWLNGFLKDVKYAAGTKHLTVADHVLIACISSYEAAGFDIQSYPHTLVWYERCKEDIDWYEYINAEGANLFGEYVKSLIAEKNFEK